MKISMKEVQEMEKREINKGIQTYFNQSFQMNRLKIPNCYQIPK